MSSESSTEAAANATPGPADADFWFIWFIAWLGITAAGGLFGLIAGSISGMLIGPFIAAFFAVPVVFTIAVITWAFWLTRFSVIMAAVAGAEYGNNFDGRLLGPHLRN